MKTGTGGLIGGLASGLGSLFTIGAQKRAATTSFKRQKELFDYQNAYNTPAKQMERLKQAGLNPALMYGQGNTGNATGFAGVQKADVTGPGLAQAVASGTQMSLVNSQKALNDSQSTLNAIKGGVETGQLGVARDLAQSKIQLEKQQIDQSKATIGQITAQTDLAIQTINHQASTGMLKGDIVGNVAKALNINVTTPEGRKDAYTKVAGLIIGKKVLDLAPQILGGLFGRIFGSNSNKVINSIREGNYSMDEKNAIIDQVLKSFKR
jgi:hypothetical protein